MSEECGWTMGRYKAWQFTTLARSLLPKPAARAALSPGAPDVADCSFAGELRLCR
jgi:hypothetical protein